MTGSGRFIEHLAAFTALPEATKKNLVDAASKITANASTLFQSKKFGHLLNSKTEDVAQGSALVDYLVKENLAKDPSEAAEVGKGLLQGGYLRSIDDKAPFFFVSGTSDYYGISGPDSVMSIARENKIERAGILKKKSMFHFVSYYALAVPSLNQLVLYSYDLGNVPVNVINFKDSFVQYAPQSAHGVHLEYIRADKKTETIVFETENKEDQEEWVQAFINSGAVFREPLNADIANIKSFFELSDRDMAGNKVSMSDYKGKVVIVANVSSKCGLTPPNYTEFAILDKKYRDEGLVILAFPCNQFANQEPGSHEEIMEFVKQYNLTIPFFEKADVNGAHARPVFAYLKEKLPGSFGNFVKWNFTKFLIDREGNPVRRYAPKENPMLMEDEIKRLLAEEKN